MSACLIKAAIFLCHQHLWFGLSFFATSISGGLFFLCHRHLCTVSFFHGPFCIGIHVRFFVFALLALVSGYQCIPQFLLSSCALAVHQLHPWRFELEFFPSRLPCEQPCEPCQQPYKFHFEVNPIWYSTIKFTKSHSAKCSLHKWAWLRCRSKSACLNYTNLTHFRHTAGRFRGNSYIIMLWVAYELLQFAATQ